MFKDEITKILSHCRERLPKETTKVVTPTYTALKELTLINEFEEEYNFLVNLLKMPQDDFEKQFKERCATRAQRNESSCLSLVNNASSITNVMYWELTKQLFNPKTFAAMLAILNPNIRYLFQVKSENFFSQKAMDLAKNKAELYPNLQFSVVDIKELQTPLTDASVLEHYIYADGMLFDLSQIQNFHFPMFRRFHVKAQHKFRALLNELYAHNHELSRLHDEVHTYYKQGITLHEVLTALVVGLQAGGELITNTTYATAVSEKAFRQFLEYWNPLPEDLKTLYGNLKNESNESLDDVIDHLEHGQCVETAATIIIGILNYGPNAPILHKRAQLTQSEVRAVELSYKSRSKKQGIDIKREIQTLKLPEYWLKQLIPHIELNNRGDFVLQLFNFPTALYSDLLSSPSIDCTDIEVCEELSAVLVSNILNSTQCSELIKAIKANHQRFGPPGRLLYFAVYAKCLELVTFALTLFKDKDNYLSEIVKLGKNDSSILHLSAQRPNLFPFILSLFPSDEVRRKAIEETDNCGNNAFHNSCISIECLNIILALYTNQEERYQLLCRRNHIGETALHILMFGNQESLIETLLKSINDPTQRSKLIHTLNNDNETVLHFASDEAKVRAIFKYLPSDAERIALIKIQDKAGCTAISNAYEFPEALAEMLRLLNSDEDRLQALNAPNKDGSSVLYYAALFPEVLQTILNSLSSDESRMRVLETKVMDHVKLAYKATINAESINSLIKALPTDRVLNSLLKIEDSKGITLFDNLAKEPNLLELIIAQFKDEQMRKQFQIRTEKKNTKDHPNPCTEKVPVKISNNDDPIETFIKNKVKGWAINANKKSVAVKSALTELNNKGINVRTAIKDSNSSLYKALNTHRYGFFTLGHNREFFSFKTKTLLDIEELLDSEGIKAKRI